MTDTINAPVTTVSENVASNENVAPSTNAVTAEPASEAPVAKPVNTFEVKDFVLEDIYTKSSDRTDMAIEDAIIKMYEVFGKLPEPAKDTKVHTLKAQEDVDLRLAQLGIDNPFALCDGGYRSHTFNIACAH